MARLREDLGRPGTAHPSPVGTPCRTRGIIARAGLNRAPQNGSHWFRMEPVIIMLPCPRKRCTAVMSLLSASSLVATVGAARAGANEPPAPTAKGLGRGCERGSSSPLVASCRTNNPLSCRSGAPDRAPRPSLHGRCGYARSHVMDVGRQQAGATLHASERTLPASRPCFRGRTSAHSLWRRERREKD